MDPRYRNTEATLLRAYSDLLVEVVTFATSPNSGWGHHEMLRNLDYFRDGCENVKDHDEKYRFSIKWKKGMEKIARCQGNRST